MKSWRYKWITAALASVVLNCGLLLLLGIADSTAHPDYWLLFLTIPLTTLAAYIYLWML